MLYNDLITYNAGLTYEGALIIKAPSIVNPITLNSVIVLFELLEDYSNYTTMAILSMDINPSGVLTIEVLDSSVSALASAEVISITPDGQLAVIS